VPARESATLEIAHRCFGVTVLGVMSEGRHTARLFVGNLPYDASEDALRSAFAEHGQVTSVHVVHDRYTGRSRGFAFVTMASPEQAAQAAQRMNGTMVSGRPLRVNEAEPSRRSDPRPSPR
jgi:RNA recognition motif-containing protein